MEENKDIATHKFMPLEKQFLFIIIAFSFAITAIISGIILVRDYSLQSTKMHEELKLIKELSLNNLTKDLWQLNEASIKIQIESFLKSPIIYKIEVIENQEVTYHAKMDKDLFEIFDVTYPLIYEYPEKSEIGYLKIYASKGYIYKNLKDKLLNTLFVHGIIIFITSIFVIWAFHYVVTKNINVLFNFVNKMKEKELSKEESLIFINGPFHAKSEIHFLADTIIDVNNSLFEEKKNTKKLIDDILLKNIELENIQEKIFNLNVELENKVLNRTFELNKTNKKLEQSLVQVKNFQKRIISQEKLASLGTLVAGIAHEIRNPINIIENSAKIIQMELKNEIQELIKSVETPIDPKVLEEFSFIFEDIEKLAGIIIKNTIRTSQTIQDILLQARAEDEDFEFTDIKKSLKANVNYSLEAVLAKSKFVIEPELDIDDIGIYKILPRTLSRAILNILDNAFYALIEKKENITEAYQPHILISLKDKGENFEIIIKDNGNGIPTNVRGKIFEAFKTSKPAGQGTGLGLSMANDIIKIHEGNIQVNSTKGAGTSFIISIPKIS